MRKFVFFLIFCFYACGMLGMESSSEELENPIKERQRIHAKYQRDRYLPLFAKKMDENFTKLSANTANPREMTALFTTMIAFMNAIDYFSFHATEEAEADQSFETPDVNDSKYLTDAIKIVKEAFEAKFDHEKLADSIAQARNVFNALIINEEINDLIQRRVRRDRDPDAYRREGTIAGSSWNDVFAIVEYEVLSWYIAKWNELLPVARERALLSLPSDLGKNIFYHPDEAFNFLNTINDSFCRDLRPNLPLSEKKYYTLAWIGKIKSDINNCGCAYFFLAKRDEKGKLHILKDLPLAEFLAKIFLYSGGVMKNQPARALPKEAQPILDTPASPALKQLKKNKKKIKCLIQ